MITHSSSRIAREKRGSDLRTTTHGFSMHRWWTKNNSINCSRMWRSCAWAFSSRTLISKGLESGSCGGSMFEVSCWDRAPPINCHPDSLVVSLLKLTCKRESATSRRGFALWDELSWDGSYMYSSILARWCMSYYVRSCFWWNRVAAELLHGLRAGIS